MPTQPKPRGKRRPHRRQEILDAAISLFAERGYHATGMNDIGAVVGISGPGIYRHFNSKESILEAAIEDAAETMLRRVTKIAEETADPAERLERLVAHAVRNLVDNHELYATAINERRNLSDQAQALFARSQRLRVEEWALPLAEIRPELSQTQARYLVTIAQSMLILSSQEHQELDADRFARLLHNSAMAALLDAPRAA